MSENTEQNHLPENKEELEKLLRELEPSALEAPLKEELLRDLDRIEAVRNPAGDGYDPTRVQWGKVIPVTLLSIGMVLTFTYSKFKPAASELASNPAAPKAVESAASASLNPAPSGQFEPVSSQGYLLNASSGGVVETENGPGEIMQLQYRDAYHWHDPNTGTNIRFFQPREENIVVPLITD